MAKIRPRYFVKLAIKSLTHDADIREGGRKRDDPDANDSVDHREYAVTDSQLADTFAFAEF